MQNEEQLILGGVDTALAIADFIFPAAGPIISIAKAAIPALIAAEPEIKQAVEAGKSAIEAAAAASPGLKGQLATMLQHALGGNVTEAHLENVARIAVRLPRMTPQEETLYQRSLQESGYDPRNDYDEHGNMKVGGA